MTEPIRVLHVDDEPDFGELTAEFLEREAARIAVTTVESAAAGLDRLDEEAFDCVVSDYQLSDTDGVAFLGRVREDHPDLPFVLFTGKGSEAVASEAIAAGATDYLQKGSGTEQYELLANRVLNAVEQYRSKRRAADLERVRTLASDVTQTLVRATDRSEITAQVCETIAAAEPYQFVAIGHVDPETGAFETRARAGVEGASVAGVAVQGSDTGEETPLGRAVHGGSIAVSDTAGAVRMDRSGPGPSDRGLEAVALVPLDHDDERYGHLAVFSGREGAFDETELDLLSELGDDVAHALHAAAVRDELRASRERFRALFENSPDPVVRGDVRPGSGRHVVQDVNAAFEEAFGFGAADVVGRDIADALVPDGDRDRHDAFRERVTAGEAVEADVVRETDDGMREFTLRVIPVGTAERPANAWFAWYTDVTERRERERALGRLHEATGDLMAAETAAEVLDVASGAAAEILDLPLNSVNRYDADADALVPVAWTEALGALFDGEPTSIPAGEGIAWNAYETGESVFHADVREAEDVLNEDTPFRSELHVPLGAHGVLTAASTSVGDFDATDERLAQVLAAAVEAALDRVERERTLAEERNRYETLVEGSHDGILIQQDGDIVFANERCGELFGYDASELVGRPITAVIAPEDRELVRGRSRRRVDPAADPPPNQYEVRYRTEAGETRVGEISVASVQYGGEPAALVAVRDVTERKRSEERLENRTEELEVLNRVVRHDIRNDVSIMLGWAEMLDGHVDETGEEYLEKILSSGAHIVELTDVARDYVETLTGGDELAVRPTPLRSLLLTELDLRQESYPAADFETAGELPDVEVRANEMLQSVFRNLLNNAVQHSDTPDPTVTVTCDETAESVVVRVADDGPGVPDDRKEAVFGKGERGLDSPGTGIGLYLVQRLVDQYGGAVHVEDNDPRGSVFVVRLPRAE
jgi:PAS domain S-box-containing protein